MNEVGITFLTIGLIMGISVGTFMFFKYKYKINVCFYLRDKINRHVDILNTRRANVVKSGSDSLIQTSEVKSECEILDRFAQPPEEVPEGPKESSQVSEEKKEVIIKVEQEDIGGMNKANIPPMSEVPKDKIKTSPSPVEEMNLDEFIMV